MPGDGLQKETSELRVPPPHATSPLVPSTGNGHATELALLRCPQTQAHAAAAPCACKCSHTPTKKCSMRRKAHPRGICPAGTGQPATQRRFDRNHPTYIPAAPCLRLHSASSAAGYTGAPPQHHTHTHTQQRPQCTAWCTSVVSTLPQNPRKLHTQPRQRPQALA